MNASDHPSPGFCPLCGRPNECAMEIETRTGEKPCWCTQVDFGANLLKRLPGEARGRACICPAYARPT